MEERPQLPVKDPGLDIRVSVGCGAFSLVPVALDGGNQGVLVLGGTLLDLMSTVVQVLLKLIGVPAGVRRLNS